MSGFFRRNKSKASSDTAPPPPPMPPDVLGEGTQTTIFTGDRAFDSDRVRQLIDSLRVLSSEEDPDALLHSMVLRAIRTVGAERGLLLGRGDDGQPVVLVGSTADGTELPGGARWTTQVVQHVFDTGEAIYDRGDDGGDFDPSQSMINLDIRSVMCVPLRLTAGQKGVLYVDARATERPFAKGDLRFFEAFADMLAIVGRNREAVEEKLRGERMARDLELVREIQDRLLPREPLSVGGYSALGRVVAADEAGGDYFDYFSLPDGRIALAVGDVTGHGAGPALLMASGRAYLRSHATDCDEADRILCRLNRHIDNDTDADRFISMFLGLLDPVTHRFSWSNAGHPPALVVRADGSCVSCRNTGMALGMTDEDVFEPGEAVELAPGDTVVLYTDGITELRQGDEMYGDARLQASVARHVGGSAAELLDGLFQDAQDWAGSEHPGQDDLTVAILRRES